MLSDAVLLTKTAHVDALCACNFPCSCFVPAARNPLVFTASEDQLQFSQIRIVIKVIVAPIRYTVDGFQIFGVSRSHSDPVF